jgi:hypothetical protein
MKKRIIYKELLLELEERKKSPEKNPHNKNGSIEEIINLDVQRTIFESNVEKSRTVKD